MNYTDEVTVLHGHLVELHAALDAAVGYHTADDLAKQYKNIGGTTRASNLTKRLEKALQRAEGILAAAEDTADADVLEA